jgi:hypothetical protein
VAFDPDYAKVALLLHFDGANGSTTFTDSSATPKAVTAAPSTAITTESPRFGTGAASIGGASGYIQAQGQSFGTDDFTVEFLAYISAGYATLLDNRVVTPSSDLVIYDTDGANNFALYAAGANRLIAPSVVSNSWVHFAVCRASGITRFFLNGVQNGGTYSDTNNYNHTTLRFGNNFVGNAGLSGKLDEVRVTPGIARYTANFTPPTEPFPDTASDPAFSAYAAAPTPFGAPATLAASIRQAWAYAASPLGAPAILAASGETFFARAAAATPLGAPHALARAVGAARVATAGPLGAGAALGQLVAVARAAASGPLGAASVVARIPILATASAPSVLGQSGVLAYHDFTVGLGDAVTLYVMDLITPTGSVRIPISSWQATLQTGSSNYVQCVIPACTVWQSAINTATEFVIYRRAVLPSGAAIEQEMARAPATTPQFDRGPLRHTCTLSGYSTAFAANANPPAIYDRALTGVRSISSGANNYRARCAVDWLLRPGQRAFVDGVPFIVSYINYYAPSGFDSYMDVGS